MTPDGVHRKAADHACKQAEARRRVPTPSAMRDNDMTKGNTQTNHRRALAAGLLLAGASLPAFAWAADADAAAEADADDQDSIVVSGAREAPLSPTTLSVDPAAGIGSVFTLDREAISGLVVTSANDLLRTIPGVAVADLGQGGIPNGVTIRGWSFVGDGASVRGVIDGATNNFVTGPNNNGSDDLNILIPEIIGSIKVVKGPFDTRYSGNFAYAGTAIFTTADSVPNRVAVSAASFGKQRVVANVGNGQDEGPTKYYIAVDAFSSRGYRDNNDDDKVNIFGKITSRVSAHDTVKLTAQLYNDEFGQPGYIRSDLVEQGLIDKRSATSNLTKGDRHSQGITLEWEHRDEVFNFDANAWFQHVKQYRSINRQSRVTLDDGAFPANAFDDERYTFGAGFNPWVNFNVAGAEAIFRAGAEVRGDVIDTVRAPVFNEVPVPQPTFYDAWTGFFNYTKATVWNPDVYAELSVKPAPWLKVTGGIRQDWFTYKGDFTVYSGTALGIAAPFSPGRPTGTPASLTTYDIDGSAGKPTLHGGIVIGPVAGFTLLGNFGEGITSQNLNQLTAKGGVNYSAIFLNPDIAPTKLNTKEVVLKYDNEALGLNLQGGVYHTLNQGELGTDPLTGNPANLGRSIRKGFDLSGQLRVYDREGTSLRIGANYNEVDAHLKGSKNFITGTPPWIAGYNIDAATPVGGEGDRIRLNVQHTFVGGTYLTNGPANIVLSTSPAGNVYGLGILRNGDYDRLAFKLSYERPSFHNLRVWFSGVVVSGDRIAEMTTTSVGFFNDAYTRRGVTYRVGNYAPPFRAEAGFSIDF